MNMISSLLLTLHLLVGITIIALVLLQHGKGADMGAAFGSGSSGSLFGSSGSANFLSRTTAVLAAVFFLTSLGLAYFANARPAASGSVVDRAATLPAPAPAQPTVPVEPAAADSKAKDIPK